MIWERIKILKQQLFVSKKKNMIKGSNVPYVGENTPRYLEIIIDLCFTHEIFYNDGYKFYNGINYGC